MISGICEKYAFDSYYTVDVNADNDGNSVSAQYDKELSTDKRIEAYQSYNYRRELLSLLVRIIITIIIEMAVALIFGLWAKKQLLFLICVNVVTQIILNVLLNIINYHSGSHICLLCYVLFELTVFIIEAVLYNMLSVAGLEPAMVSLAAFYIAALCLFLQGVSLAANFSLRRIKNSAAETFNPLN